MLLDDVGHSQHNYHSAEERARINQAALAVYRMHANYNESSGASGSAIHVGGGILAWINQIEPSKPSY